jgi:hypothetical protein
VFKCVFWNVTLCFGNRIQSHGTCDSDNGIIQVNTVAAARKSAFIEVVAEKRSGFKLGAQHLDSDSDTVNSA